MCTTKIRLMRLNPRFLYSPTRRLRMNQDKFRILLFDTKYRNPNHYICLAVFTALKKHAAVESVWKVDPLDAVLVAAKNHCNLFIAFDGEELDATLCARLADICGRSVLWVTEDPYELEVNLRHSGLFDLVFTNDSSSVGTYGDKGRHLPLAGATEFHSLPVLAADESLRYQMFFAGTAWPNRSEFVRSILAQMPPDWKFKLALPSNPFLPPHRVPLPESVLSWRTSPIDFARFVNRSAVTLLLPRVFSASGGREYAETPPPRLFEAALAGGAQLVHESLGEVAQSFAPGDEIVFFSSERDFLAKATHLINDRATRDSIAGAARQRALREHTYDNRVESILAEARGIAEKSLKIDNVQRRTLLFVAHNVLPRGNFGGVEVYLERIRKALVHEWKVLFYVPGASGRDREAHLLAEDYTEIRRFEFSQSYSAALLTCPEREQAFRTILLEHNVDVAHFHHFIGHVPSLVHVSAHAGVPVAFTAHDFFPVCHEFNLLSFKNEFCGAPKVPLSQCDVCLWQKHHIAPGSQAQRRMFWDNVLRHIDLLVFNTDGALRTYAEMYPSVRQHASAHVLPVPVLDGPVRALQRSSRPLKVALLGNVTYQKGGDVICRALPLLQGAPVEFHVFGRVDGSYSHLRDRRAFPNVIVHGQYSADAPPPELLDCDVSIHVSVWPETYCLTLSEAWQLGLVPIVTDIGALGERVTHLVNGIKIAPNKEGQLVDAVRQLIDEPALLTAMRFRITKSLYMELTAHAAALATLYRGLLLVPRVQPAIGEPVRQTSLADMGIVLQASTWHNGSDLGVATPAGAKAKLMFKARKVLAFYRRNGLRPTVRIVVNRARRLL
ncbi:putative glucosylltransferase [Paraburkholderia phenoliruptrix BR3459a]|nr:putative glucosylltransferase [Paraburkholderia phenoliruptrix BR3459a]